MAAVEDSITEFGRWCFNQMSAKKSSPLSLKVAFKAFQMGRELSLEEVFRMELRVATRLVQDFPDFRNGVKALLVEKKGHPKWSHSLVTQVDEKAIQQIFSPFSNEEMEWKPN